MMTETHPQMKARHKAEMRALIEGYNQKGYTQCAAAEKLNLSRQNLNGIIKRLGIEWGQFYRKQPCAKIKPPSFDTSNMTAMQRSAMETQARMEATL